MLGGLTEFMEQIPKLQNFAEQLAQAAQEMREEQKVILENQKEILELLRKQND
jgi:hypothetical protein